MKDHSSIGKGLLATMAIAALVSAVPLQAQILADNFNRADNNAVGNGWTETETAAAGARIASNELLMSSTIAGREAVMKSTPGTYNPILTNNTCLMTWAFNMRSSRTSPSGFDSGNYGIGVILASTNSDATLGNGYAVVLGNSGTPDPLRLVRFTGGVDLNSNLTTLISGPNLNAEYMDVRVTYNANTDQWQLFYTNNGAGPFGDPLLAATSAGTATDATYTGVSAPFIGCLWNHSTGAESGRFDNFYVPSVCTTNTSVQFTGTSSTVSEIGVSTSLTVSIANFSAGQATSVDVVLTGGSAARINNYTTQTLVFPANSGANQSQTITITDNGACDGNAVLTFQLQNVTGGQGTPFVGANNTHTLTVTDNEQVASATSLDFEAGTLAGWTQGTAGHWASSTTAPINGARSLKHNLSGVADVSHITYAIGGVDLSDAPTTWRFQMKNGNWDPSGNNRFWFWLAANEQNVQSATVDGYAVGLNMNSTTDLITLYKVEDGTSGTVTDLVVSAQDWNNDGIYGIEVTRTAAGLWDLRIDNNGAFDNLISAGTSNDTQFLGVANLGVFFEFTATRAGELWVDDVLFSQTICRPIWYSRGNGSEADNIWSHTRTGTAGPATFDQNATAVVQAFNTVTTVGASLNLRRLNVETGGAMALGTTDVSLYGSQLNIDGPLTMNGGSISFLGDVAATLDGSQSLVADDLTVNKTGGLDLNIDSLGIRGTLQLTTGVFNTTGTVVSLLSSATETGRLGAVGAGATYTGNLRVERYIPAGLTDWRCLGSPLQGRQINNWHDDFFTAGYPLSDYYPFIVNGNNWPSIRSYDETDPGPALTDGLVGPTDANDPLTVGKGFVAWCGDGLNTTNSFVIDLQGLPTIATTPITLPMTWTDNSLPATDGWNLVANPVPSPIDFGAISLGAQVDNFYYVFDPQSGNNASWDEGLGLSNPALTLNGNIQSSQSFWLKATGPAVTTTVEEADKILEPIDGGVFLQVEDMPRPMFRVRVSSGLNPHYDEALVHFIAGEPTLGAHDITKFTFAHPEAPQISTLSADGVELAMNAYGELAQVDVPVGVKVAVDGQYTLTIFGTEGLSGTTCLILEDTELGTMTPVVEGATYDFTTLASTDAYPARFIIHSSVPATFAYTDVLCAGEQNGQASMEGAGTGPWDYTWMDEQGNAIAQELQVNGPSTITGLDIGEYSVSVSSDAGCGALVQEFIIQAPDQLDAQLSATNTTCSAVENGAVDMELTGGVAPFTYAWSNGAISEDLDQVAADTYSVIVTDANGCTLESAPVLVAAEAGPIATFLPSASVVEIGEDVEFFNMSTWGANMSWDFGDGATGSAIEPFHQYSAAGMYTVTLTVELNGCVSTHTEDVLVNFATGVPTLSTDVAQVWMDQQHVVVDLHQDEAQEMVITVLDAAGRIVSEQRTRIAVGRIRIPVGGVAQGTVLVRLIRGVEYRTYKLSLTR